MTETSEALFEGLLAFLQRERGFDFRGYKRPSLMRRVHRRMQTLGIERFDEYRDYLEVHPDEFALLFNTILINVTSFFRDAAPWQFVEQEVIPQIVRARGDGLLRVWSAGCASGEEPYSLAMLFAEAMGADALRARVKIYATDIDEEALAHARLASYSAKDLEPVSAALREKYFERSGARHVFRADLRRSLIFGRNDLVQDAPISRLDLLACRNTLMYFNAETQARILSRFHYALGASSDASGFLFVGRSEMLLTPSRLFTPVDQKSRVFAKVPQPGARRPAAPAAVNDNGADMNPNRLLDDQASDEFPVARIVVDAKGNLAFANLRARLLFGLTPKDVGRPLQDLEVSHRPADLRALIEQASFERRAVTQAAVERHLAGGELQFLDILVQPLYDEAQLALGTGVTFVDVTRSHALQEELRNSREELQTTSEELRSSNEELATTNEELQSSNEELETTNEELQSTNEELETMNEELQSSNEELRALNEELRRRTDEADRANAFLESVLGSLRSASVVVNHNLDVLSWNHRAEDLWGLRADEVRGKSLLNLDIGLPVAELRGAIRGCLQGEGGSSEVVLDAVNRRGKAIKCRVTCSPFTGPGEKREGVILQMEEMQ